MFGALADVVTRRPGRVLIGALLVTAACGILGIGLSDRLASQGFNDPDSESARAFTEIGRATGGDPEAAIVALVSDGTRITPTAPINKAIDRATRILAGDPDTGMILGPFVVGGVAGTYPQFISTDGKTAMVTAYLKPGRIESDAATRAKAAFSSDKNVRLGGSLLAQHEVSNTVSDDLARAEMIAFPLLFILALFVFRGLIAAAVPLIIGAITIPVTFALIGLFDRVTDLSIFALNLTTGLGLGLAIDYSLLMVTRFREELDTGIEPNAAVRRTVTTAGRTVVFSGLTVAGSTAALAIFPLKFLYSMGIGGACVALASVTVALTVLPAMLMLLGHRINKFSLSRRSTAQSQAAWYRLAKAVMRRPLAVSAVTVAAIALLALPVAGIGFTSVDHTVLPKQSQTRQVQSEIERDFARSDAAATLFVIAKAGPTDRDVPKRTAVFAAGLDTVKHVGDPIYIGADTWRFDVFPTGSRFSDSAQDAVAAIRDHADPAPRWVSGHSASFVDQRAAIVDNLPLALSLVAAVTFIVLFLMTGSVVLPIKTFIMNLATLGATFGLLVLIFQDGRLEGVLDYTSRGALDLTQPILLFAVAFGLATDYGVFLLGRIKELSESGLSNEEAVAQGVARTGRVITAAALLFCVAIGSFATSQIVFIKELGVGTALAVAIDATIIRALLVPALMTMLGRYNWWAPKPLKRLHARVGLREVSAPSATVGERSLKG